MTASYCDRRAIPPGLVISLWNAPDGWPMRRFDWAPKPGAPARGSMMFQTGRGDFFEKYIEAMAHWRRAGWAITGFDWRGQGGSGRPLPDPLIGHAISLDPLLADMAAFLPEWMAAAPGPHVVIAHSMGGNLTLRLLAEHRPKLAAAVLVAPMLGLNAGPIPPIVAAAVARGVARLGLSARPAWRRADTSSTLTPERQTNLTSSIERYADESWWKQAHPELDLGPPTWGWLAAAYHSIARIARPGALEAIKTPVLMIAAAGDRLVRPGAIRAAAARVRNGRLMMIRDGAHELLREADAIRLPVIQAIDGFLDEAAAAP